MNNIKIKELKEINQQCYELFCNYPDSLDTIENDDISFNNKKITKENFKDFLNKIDYNNNNKLNVQDFLFISVSKIKDIFGNIIKENFPFYTNYDISFSMCHGIIVTISVFYYYMGKNERHDDVISLNSKYLEKNIQYLESVLTDIKKDMISYPDNEIQQKFLREC